MVGVKVIEPQVFASQVQLGGRQSYRGFAYRMNLRLRGLLSFCLHQRQVHIYCHNRRSLRQFFLSFCRKRLLHGGFNRAHQNILSAIVVRYLFGVFCRNSLGFNGQNQLIPCANRYFFSFIVAILIFHNGIDLGLSALQII